MLSAFPLSLESQHDSSKASWQQTLTRVLRHRSASETCEEVHVQAGSNPGLLRKQGARWLSHVLVILITTENGLVSDLLSRKLTFAGSLSVDCSQCLLGPG